MGLRDSTKKMSKSDTNDSSRINLTDDVTVIFEKIKKAKTDSIPKVYLTLFIRSNMIRRADPK